jgi:hypothetical protein
MAAFNYRQLIRQVPARTWQFYFQARKIALPVDHDWTMSIEKLAKRLIAAIEELEPHRAKIILAELRRVHAFANRRGIYALRNAATPDAALHDDFHQFTS